MRGVAGDGRRRVVVVMGQEKEGSRGIDRQAGERSCGGCTLAGVAAAACEFVLYCINISGASVTTDNGQQS